MFEKRKARRSKEDEMFKKVISLLENIDDWAKTDDIEYSYLKSDLKIECGKVYGYDSTYMVIRISSPDKLDIPWRFRDDIKLKLIGIKNRKNEDSPINFLNDYLNEEYPHISRIDVDKDKHPDAKLWLQEQGILQFYIKDKTFWFKNLEDAMAFKLVWIENDS